MVSPAEIDSAASSHPPVCPCAISSLICSNVITVVFSGAGNGIFLSSDEAYYPSNYVYIALCFTLNYHLGRLFSNSQQQLLLRPVFSR